jgi:hypothetical protein
MTSKGDTIKAAMEVAEDVAAGRLDPADVDKAATDACRELFGTVIGPDDPLWSLQVEVCRGVLGVGGAIPAGELTEWAAVARRRAQRDEPTADVPAEAETPASMVASPHDDTTSAAELEPLEAELLTAGEFQDATPFHGEPEPEPEVNPHGAARLVVARGRGWPADNGLREI